MISSGRVIDPLQMPVPIVANTMAMIQTGPWLNTSHSIGKKSWLAALRAR
jgi:hypothetical protein